MAGKAKSFIGAIMQTLKGAMGSDKKGYLEEVLATQVAYFLFDDFETIGKKSTGVNRLHLMDLNGIYLPLSVILKTLADALERAENRGLDNPKSVVQVSIAEKDILGESGTWETQKEAALKTQVSTHFLAGFK
jgi:hypothetical protein